jgi:Transglycosylase SLT domain
VPAGSLYNRLAMMSFGRCKLQAKSSPSSPGPGCPSLPAAASGLVHLARRDLATAEYRHQRRIRQPTRIAGSYQPKTLPTKSQPRSISMPVTSSLGSLFASIVGKRVSTRSGHGNDSLIWADRNRAARNHLITSCRLTCFCAVFAATMFPTLAFSGPQQASPPQAEVSVVQLPPGTRLHSARHSQALAAPQPHSTTPPAALKKMAEDAATAHTLPVNYFLRLIRQESGFDPNSVSSAGAQGIAQFMPTTASNRGLKDPFDPAEALPKSAELLSELKDHFGNLGLAAAAYNAGPERIRKWLAGESPLPEETINYVRVITGHDVADWAKSNNLTIDLAADAIELPRAHFNRLSWEAQLLATVQATSTNATTTSTTVSTGKLTKASLKSSETSLCSGCIVQSAY